MKSGSDVGPRRVTSVEIGRRGRGLCWAFGLALVSAGGVATFLSDNQAGTTALILFGGLLLFIAITRRVPLLIEVGTAKLDTSYEESDAAFEAGRDSAVASPETGDAGDSSTTPVDLERVSAVAYRGAVAAQVAGITYRQLDYWARTELISPSALRSGAEDEPSVQLYSAHDVVLLKIVKALLDAGVSLTEIRHMIDVLQPLPMEEMAGLVLRHDSRGSRLVQSTDTRDLTSPAIIIPLGPIATRVFQDLEQFI